MSNEMLNVGQQEKSVENVDQVEEMVDVFNVEDLNLAEEQSDELESDLDIGDLEAIVDEVVEVEAEAEVMAEEVGADEPKVESLNDEAEVEAVVESEENSINESAVVNEEVVEVKTEEVATNVKKIASNTQEKPAGGSTGESEAKVVPLVEESSQEKKLEKSEKDDSRVQEAEIKEGDDQVVIVKKQRAPRIHTITDTLRAETVDIKRQKEKQELSEYMYLKTPIIGKLENCEPTSEGEVGVVMYGSTRIVIPVDHLIDLGTPEVITDDGVALYRPIKNIDQLVRKDAYAHTELRKRLGMEMDYIVKGMHEDQENPGRYSFVASRTEAMKAKRKKNYYPDARGDVQLAEGDITECRVVSVGTKSITVEVEGVETLIRAEELTYKHIGNFSPLYKAGDIILCKITSVEYGSKKDREVKITASVKQTYENPMIDLMGSFKEGASYDGKVSHIFEKGIFVNLTDEIDCYCHFPMYLPRPVLGQMVAVDIQRVDTKNFKLQGRISKLREILNAR